MKLVVAIDGPAGTGKSSAARILAKKFNFIYVDTGAIYRALAFLVEKYDKNAENMDEVLPLISHLSVLIDDKELRTKIIVDGQFVDSELRTENISRLSSIVSQHKKVRESLLPVQRNLVNEISTGAIFEGRDIGTVVFPHAPVKIFITANPETRAQRRYDEIKNSDQKISFDAILEAIQKRDERDEKRSSAPMQKAQDAHVIDSSTMTLEEVIDEATGLINQISFNDQKEQKLW